MRIPPDKTLWFTFGSHPAKVMSIRWKAKLTLPAGSTAESLLPLEVWDGDGLPVAEGRFVIFGLNLEIRDGKASVRYADFVRGKHETDLWLHRPGVPPMPGGLTFE